MASSSAASVSEANNGANNDGPVLSMMNKRLRALRKKLNRIVQTEESKAQGKPINKEQEDVLKSKPAVLALIDEYEKLRQPLAAALVDELKEKEERLQSQSICVAESPKVSVEVVVENGDEKKGLDVFDEEAVGDLLKLLYFGTLFDVKPHSDFTTIMLTRVHERSSCLTYDYVTEDATDLLAERDLDLVSLMGGLVISRPADSTVSHKNALQACLHHAKLWLRNSEELIHPEAGISYASLKDRLNKILSSDYFTMTPQMTTLSEQTAAEAAAAAAAGNFVQHVSQDGGRSVYQGEGAQHHQMYEGTESEGNELSRESSMNTDELSPQDMHLQKEKVDGQSDPLDYISNSILLSQDQAKQFSDAEEQNGRDVEFREHQDMPRRLYPRGGGRGGRRGYINGRGGRGARGGGYQNGRNQYYDGGNNSYPRNYYAPRGGRGGGQPRGMMYSNNSSNHVTPAAATAAGQ